MSAWAEAYQAWLERRTHLAEILTHEDEATALSNVPLVELMRLHDAARETMRWIETEIRRREDRSRSRP